MKGRFDARMVNIVSSNGISREGIREFTFLIFLWKSEFLSDMRAVIFEYLAHRECSSQPVFH